MITDDKRKEVADSLRDIAERKGTWPDVAFALEMGYGGKEVLHDSIEDCVLAIRCGVNETEVLRFRVADVEFVSNPICDRDALLALADEMQNLANSSFLWNLRCVDVQYLIYYARRIRKALGVSDA